MQTSQSTHRPRRALCLVNPRGRTSPTNRQHQNQTSHAIRPRTLQLPRGALLARLNPRQHPTHNPTLSNRLHTHIHTHKLHPLNLQLRHGALQSGLRNITNIRHPPIPKTIRNSLPLTTRLAVQRVHHGHLQSRLAKPRAEYRGSKRIRLFDSAGDSAAADRIHPGHVPGTKT